MTDELVSRLRGACVGYPAAEVRWPHRILHEAADELEAKARRIAELERALRTADTWFDEAETWESAHVKATIKAALSGTTPPADALVEALTKVRGFSQFGKLVTMTFDEVMDAQRAFVAVEQASLTAHRGKGNDNG